MPLEFLDMPTRDPKIKATRAATPPLALLDPSSLSVLCGVLREHRKRGCPARNTLTGHPLRSVCDRRTTAEPLAAEENRSLVPALARYRLETVQSFFKRYVLDFGALNRDHHAPLLFVHHIDGAHTQTGCQHAVVAGGCVTLLIINFLLLKEM